jgi:hypothetical protein
MARILSRSGVKAFPTAGRVCPQVKNGFDLDALLAETKEHAVGKASNQGAPDIR